MGHYNTRDKRLRGGILLGRIGVSCNGVCKRGGIHSGSRILILLCYGDVMKMIMIMMFKETEGYGQ